MYLLILCRFQYHIDLSHFFKNSKYSKEFLENCFNLMRIFTIKSTWFAKDQFPIFFGKWQFYSFKTLQSISWGSRRRSAKPRISTVLVSEDRNYKYHEIWNLHCVPGESILCHKYAFIKKSTIFTQSLRNFVKMRYSWVPHIHKIS